MVYHKYTHDLFCVGFAFILVYHGFIITVYHAYILHYPTILWWYPREKIRASRVTLATKNDETIHDWMIPRYFFLNIDWVIIPEIG